MKKDAHNRAPNASMILYKPIFMVSYFTLNVKKKFERVKIMDKTKQKLKKRRRQQTLRDKADRERKLADETNAYYTEHGMRTFSRKEIVEAYKDVERESTLSAMIVLAVVTLRAAHKQLGFGARRLWRLSTEITARITWVGNAVRSITQLDDELRLDAHIKCADIWNDEKHIPKDVGYAEYQRRDAVLRTVPCLLPIFIHAVFYTLFKNPISRPSVRLDRITRTICESVKYGIEHDTISSYREELANVGLIISETGNFSCDAIDQEEYEQGIKKINLHRRKNK